ncbi:hypothetical protein C8J57DRAFT_1574959 [Mycena rebaudengoi]|nr:hypothetical protein C8J57DRAFT_1574959 [Mycena rebaudengoi]
MTAVTRQTDGSRPSATLETYPDGRVGPVSDPSESRPVFATGRHVRRTDRSPRTDPDSNGWLELAPGDRYRQVPYRDTVTFEPPTAREALPVLQMAPGFLLGAQRRFLSCCPSHLKPGSTLRRIPVRLRPKSPCGRLVRRRRLTLRLRYDATPNPIACVMSIAVPVAPECEQDFTLFASASMSRPVRKRRRLTLLPLFPSPPKLLLRIGVGKQPLETALASGKSIAVPAAPDCEQGNDAARMSPCCYTSSTLGVEGRTTREHGKTLLYLTLSPLSRFGTPWVILSPPLSPYLRLPIRAYRSRLPNARRRHPYLRVPQAHTFTARPCWMTRAQMAAYPTPAPHPTPAPRLSPYRAVGVGKQPIGPRLAPSLHWHVPNMDASRELPRCLLAASTPRPVESVFDLQNRVSRLSLVCTSATGACGWTACASRSAKIVPELFLSGASDDGDGPSWWWREQEGEQPHPGNRGVGDCSREIPSPTPEALKLNLHVSPLRASPRRSVQHIGVPITPLHRARRAGSGFVNEEGVRMRDPPVPSPAADVASAVKTHYIEDCPQCPSSTVRGRLRLRLLGRRHRQRRFRGAAVHEDATPVLVWSRWLYLLEQTCDADRVCRRG